MVMGDFNAAIGKSVPGVVGNHLLGGQTSDNGERLVSFASVNGLCITNTFFPHKQIHQATWYPPDARARPSTKDFVLVKQRLQPSVLDTRVYRGADLDSDHRLVIVSLRPKLAKRRKQQQKKGFDTELLQQIDQRAEYLQSIRRSFDDRKRQGNVEERWNELKVAIGRAADEHLHRKKKAQKAWITGETLDLVEAKKRAFSRWQEHRTDVNRREEYVDLCKKVRRAMRKDKEQWLDGMMKDMEEDMRHNRQDRFFKKMKRLLNSRVTPVDTILDEDGQPVQKGEEKLSRWRRHFQEVLNVDSAMSEEAVADLEDNSHLETPEVNREEVERAVKKLENKKAGGDDRIVAELVKNGGEAMIDWMMELVQEVWKTRQVPQEWRNATLVPIYKKRDRRVCGNYRGVSLLSVPGKVLTLILLERLQAIIEPQLMEAQCGFREGRGTVEQIWVTIQVVERAAEYHTPVLMCFVDLTKEYDSVDRSALVAVLKSYGVPHQLVDIIQALYTVHGVKSEQGTAHQKHLK